MLLAALVIATLGVNAFKLDEWDAIVAWLLAVREQGYSVAILFYPHNEHRIPLPRLLFALLHGHGPHLVCGMLLSLAVMGVSFTLLYRRIVEPALRATPLPRGRLGFLLGALFFSFGQKENLLWNFQLAWSLAILGFVTAVLGLHGRRNSLFFGGLLLCYLCSAHWAALIPLGVFDSACRIARVRRGASRLPELGAAALRLLGLLGLLALYVRGTAHGSLAVFFDYATRHPLLTATYYLSLLGNIHAWHGPDFTAPLAPLGGLLFLGLLGYLWRRRLLRLHDPELYLMLAMMALVLLIALGRAHLGVHQALDSRYQPCTLFGWLALLSVLLRKLGTQRWVRRLVTGCLLNVLCASLCALGVVITFDSPNVKQGLKCQKEFLHQQLPLSRPECKGLLYPDSQRLTELTRAAARRGLL